jgi:hypothetical protein
MTAADSNKSSVAWAWVLAAALTAAGHCSPAAAQLRALAQRRVMAQPMAAAADGAAQPASPGGEKAGVHIPQGRAVNFTYALTDGAGFRWDLQYYGTVGQGTNYAYSGGLYLQINGNNVHSNGRGWANADGDEIEIGPYNHENLRISRRIKVYRDQGLARWMDIYENPGTADATVNARVYTNTNWTVNARTFSSGKQSFTDKDYAFITQTQGGNAPSVLHYVCDHKSKIRPSINVQNNQIYVDYAVPVPAGKTTIICYFESQSNSVPDLEKMMKALRPRNLLKDLPASVRKLIANMPGSMGGGEVELERAESSDVVLNRTGDPIYGTITNLNFSVETLFGTMSLPADQVIGLASAGGEDEQFRVLLAGGQIIAGRMPAEAKVQITMPAGGALQVPFTDVRQCSYRISKTRPEDTAFAGPLMVLRTGDRVAFDPASVQLKFRTPHGTVNLNAADLVQVSLDNPGNAVHRATFLNGSKLGGFLEPDRIPLKLKLGPELTVARNLIARIQFATEEKLDSTLDATGLSNGDELFGRLAAESLVFQTDYGTVTLRPENIQAMTFSQTHMGRSAVLLWDGSVLRGQCQTETLAFQLVPGPTLDIYIGQYTQVRRSQALPPKDIRDRLQKLIAQLGAESYKDRTAATEELVKMGKGIIPLLQQHLTTGDPETRQRIEDVIDKLGGTPGTPRPGGGGGAPGMMNGQVIFQAGG